MYRLTQSAQLNAAYQHIAALIQSSAEWFYTIDDQSHAIARDEIQISISYKSLFLSLWTDKGTRIWKVRRWMWTGTALLLEASRRMGAEQSVIELSDRKSVV